MLPFFFSNAFHRATKNLGVGNPLLSFVDNRNEHSYSFLVSLSLGLSVTFFWIPRTYVGDGNCSVAHGNNRFLFWVQNTVVSATNLA